MSNQPQMDNFFKETLNSYSPEVPAGAWERIAATRKKRRVGIIWWQKWLSIKGLIITAMLGFIVTGGLYISKNKETQTAGFSTKNATKSIDHLQDLAKPATTTSKEKNVIQVELSTKEKNEPKVNASFKETINKLAITTGRSDNNTQLKLQKIISEGKKRNNVKQPNVEDAMIAGNESTINGSQLSYEKYETIKEQIFSKMPFSASPKTALSFADKSFQQIVLNGIIPPGCPKAEKDAAGNKMYWEVYSGIDYASKKYSDTSNSVFQEKRKATTSFQSAYSAGFRFTRVFNNGISFRTGLNYSQINEKFSFIQSNIVQTTYIIDAVNGDTTGSFTVRGTRYKTTYNKYRSVDIPLLLGYEVGNGRLHANFNAGAIVNIYSWQKGELLDTNYQPVSITTGKGNNAFHYKTNAGVGFTAAASVYYKLNDRLHLLAEPYFRYNFSPISKEILSLQERFTTIGLRIGLRIDLQ
jgi:hypothetical protein